jgi:hypothetical protein
LIVQPQQRTALGEIAVAMLLAAAALWLIDRLSGLSGWLASFAGLASALTFVAVPLLVLRLGQKRDLPVLDDPLGIDRAPLWRGLGLGVVASLIVLPLFAIGLDAFEVRVLRHSRLGIAALQSAGVGFQGRSAVTAGHVVLLDDRHGLAVENHTQQAVRIAPACEELPACAPRTLAPGGRTLLPANAAAELRVLDATGAPLADGVVIAAGSGEALGDPIHAAPSLWWLLSWLFSQLLVVALPEEMFFRGYVLGRLRGCFAPQRTLLGVPFGLAHVLSAALFALIHLVLVPSPVRLLVFFPALLFAWLAERSRGVFAPAAHHALANVCQTALLLLYAPR